jgi:hypothetical protein
MRRRLISDALQPRPLFVVVVIAVLGRGVSKFFNYLRCHEIVPLQSTHRVLVYFRVIVLFIREDLKWTQSSYCFCATLLRYLNR